MNENVKEIMEEVATDALTGDIVEEVVVKSGMGLGKKIAVCGGVILAGLGIYEGFKWLKNRKNKDNLLSE